MAELTLEQLAQRVAVLEACMVRLLSMAEVIFQQQNAQALTAQVGKLGIGLGPQKGL